MIRAVAVDAGSSFVEMYEGDTFGLLTPSLLSFLLIRFDRFWSGGAWGIVGNLLTAFAPLVSQRLLRYIQDSYAYSHGTSTIDPGSAGKGIGFAFALWAMQQISSIVMMQFLQRSLVTGFILRGALIAAISRKSIRLSVCGPTAVSSDDIPVTTR